MYTDKQGRTWYIMERDDGSISIYYTQPNVDLHFVVYDTLDIGERKPLVNQSTESDDDEQHNYRT